MGQLLSIGIADSQSLTRLGIRSLLDEQQGLEIAFEATDQSELEEAMQTHRIAILIIDYKQPGHFNFSGLQLLKQKYPDCHIMVISADEEKQSIYQVLEMGVHAYLTKSCGEDEVSDALKAVARGEKFYCTRILDILLEKSFAKDPETAISTPLSARELEILQLVAKGFVAKEIADTLNLSTHTVYTHRKNILKKLGVSSTSELVLAAINYGLVEAEL